jgi:hypothetical protein
MYNIGKFISMQISMSSKEKLLYSYCVNDSVLAGENVSNKVPMLATVFLVKKT